MKPTPLRDEPLLRFVALGALVFLADRALALSTPPRDDARRIELSPSFVEGLAARHAARAASGAVEPSPDALVHDYVREEVLYREAMARGLDRGDSIVRRRLVQTMELVLTTELDVPSPDDGALTTFLAGHPSEFAEPHRTTLEHVYFARRRGASLHADAEAALVLATAGADTTGLGDAFLSGNRVGPATEARLDATFGEGFGLAIAAVESGTWAGPVEGALGLHLVRIEARTLEHAPTLAEVRGVVRAAWLEAERQRLADLAIDALVMSYVVVVAEDSE